MGLAGISAQLCALALAVGCGGSTGGDECEGAECPALPGGQCQVDGVTYQSGATGIPAEDGCNTCSCHEGQLACTLLGCLPDGPAACNYDGQVVPHGETRPSTDGCNTCSCNNGQMACTERACVTSCTSDARCGDQAYCAFPEGYCSNTTAKFAAPPADAELVAAPDGECRTRPDVCTDDYSPVCGCNGVTYGNACAAAGAGVNIASRGACASN